jgi:hypothetical protein
MVLYRKINKDNLISLMKKVLNIINLILNIQVNSKKGVHLNLTLPHIMYLVKTINDVLLNMCTSKSKG